MRRISVEEVKAAYEKTGLRPVQRVDCGNGRPGSGYFNHRKSITERPECGCALAALFLAENTLESFGEVDASFWADRTFERSYRYGFTEAFDGDEQSERLAANDQYKQGYADGSAVREALWPKGWRVRGCLAMQASFRATPSGARRD